MDANEVQQDFDKPNGVITMKIEKFNEFVREGKDARKFSNPIFVRGLPWKILAKPREIRRRSFNYRFFDREPQKYFGYFLQCNAEDQESNWGCRATAKLKLLAQKEGKKDYLREIKHIFNAKENIRGFAQLVTFEELMDPEKGYYDESSDSITLSAEIKADIPVGIELQPRMFEDLGNLFDKRNKYSDCTLISSDGVEFNVYKGILACRSPVFEAMFEHKMIEANEGIVNVKDIRSEVLEQMLRFIYSGKQPNMENIVDELLVAAEKYQLDKLKMFCERKLVISMNIENASELLVLASQHFSKFLKANAISYIKENSDEVMKTESWKMLDKELLGEIVKAFGTKKN